MTRERRKRKNPHAVALGRRGAKIRLEKVSPEERSRIAKDAALARWMGSRMPGVPSEEGEGKKKPPRR